jgi:hypothetical protein
MHSGNLKTIPFDFWFESESFVHGTLDRLLLNKVVWYIFPGSAKMVF